MEGPTAVWLAMTLAAPITLVPQIALLRLFHSRKSVWHPLDILIVSLLVAQLCCTTLTFGISAAALIRHAGLWQSMFFQGNRTPLCAFLICGWAAAHTLQAATLATFAVDRALTVRWPYKYRLSVRRTQIRYHVVVLAIISLLVGAAAFFATTDSNNRTHSALTGGLHNSPATGSKELLNTMNSQNGTDNRDRETNANSTVEDKASNETTLLDDYIVTQDGCAFLPHMFDGRYALFWLCLHGVLFLATVAALMVVLVTSIMLRCCGGSERLGSGSDLRTLGNVSDGSSGTLPPPPPPPPRYTPTPMASLRHLQQHLSDANLSALARSNQNLLASDKTYIHVIHQDQAKHLSTSDKPSQGNHYSAAPMELAWNRQRHSTVAAVLIVSYFLYHLPLLVLTTVGTYFEQILPNWPFSSMALGLGLVQSLLLMVLLVLIDPLINGWMVDSLKPKPASKRSPVISEAPTLEQTITPLKLDEETRYHLSQLYSHEAAEVKFPLTNGSLFAHLMNPPSADGARVRDRRTSRMGISAYDHRQRAVGPLPSPIYLDTKAPLLTFMSRSKILASNGLKPQVEPLYSDPLPGTLEAVPVCSASPISSKFRRPEPIYATLSETMSSSNTLVSVNRSRRNAGRQHAMDSEDEGSATESAGDDFEFHNTRSSRQTLVVHDAVMEHARKSPDFISHQPTVTQDDAELKQRAKVTRSATYRILCNGLDVKCAKRQDPKSTLTASSESQHGIVTCITFQVQDEHSADAPLRAPILRRSKLLTSLSMNDIDMVGNEEECARQDSIDVPVRSDSLFSLYKIDVPLNVEIEPDAHVVADQVKEPSTVTNYQTEVTHHPSQSKPQFDTHFQIRSSVELSKIHWTDHGHRKTPHRNPSQRQDDAQQPAMPHYRKKSISRSRTAVLQRFQQRSNSDQSPNPTPTKANSVVSIAALKAALSQSSASYLDNGDIYPMAAHREKTVFVSEYI